MSWIDCKLRKPTEDDGDQIGRVYVRTKTGGLDIALWSAVRPYHVAWMQIPAYTPIPDPPEGYEILQDYNAEPDVDALFWAAHGEWSLRGVSMRGWKYNRNHIYAIPIKPPEPQYRPFANAEEFRPFRERWWRRKDHDAIHPPVFYNDSGQYGYDWQQRLKTIEFEDGTPFGMPVN